MNIKISKSLNLWDKIKLGFIRCCYYNVVLERGYSYKRLKSKNLQVLEYYNVVLLGSGWERHTDVDGGFLHAWVWYRRKTNTNNETH